MSADLDRASEQLDRLKVVLLQMLEQVKTVPVDELRRFSHRAEQIKQESASIAKEFGYA